MNDTRCRDCGRPTGKPFALYCDTHRWTHRGKPSTYRLTPEREAYLRAHYQPSTRGISHRCAAVLGVPKWRVCRWAAELGLTGPTNKGPDWTPEEDRFLEQHLGQRHLNWIARKLTRSITAVQVRAKRLRLSRLPDGYSQQDLTLAFGVSRDTVERWQRRGWLTSSFTPMAGQPYRVSDRDVRRFVQHHPTAFALARVDQVWFLDLVFGGALGVERVA